MSMVLASDLMLFWSRELSVIHKLQLKYIVILRVRAW
jgi:hypothetical protein